ncbi:hypothetical protein OJAV_G00065920 [Oryzias javanicus]|uniref:Uncharacterized protein n=1 Tax=Oryzias javanicus TaxID=123683 RepID=A0A437D792_ORYJA|nr:hypothetical protein OJAV_G00065920 [Oryzias javanicus]
MQTQRGKSDYNDTDVTSWVSVCPQGLCTVERRRTLERGPKILPNSAGQSCSVDYCPKLGSLCQVRVQLKTNSDEADVTLTEQRVDELSATDMKELVAVPFPRCQDSLLQIPLGEWTVLRLGEGQCDITESCLEGMRAGEKCQIQLTLIRSGPVSDNQPADGNLSETFSCATVELKAFTPEKESWEMPISNKWQWVKSHKERGGGRFRSGDVWGASDSYSRALKLLIPLCSIIGVAETKESEVEEEKDTNAMDEIPSADKIKIIKAELHSNLALCQLKLNQPKLAKASAAKATQLEPSAAKAWYRLGQACEDLNELEEAKKAFKKLLELQPDLPAAQKALKGVIRKERERNAQLGLRLSKMFS